MTHAQLTTARLGELSAAIAVPAYDRSAVTPGIVHLGVGGFHRAHQARYVDDLLASGITDWGIVGVGLMPQDVRMRDALAAQDHLYTLMERAPDGAVHGRVIGSIIDYLFAPDSPEAVLAQLTDPRIRIVSLTITEGGYHVNQATGGFDASDPAIQADLEPGAVPSTAFGYVVEALARRRAAGVAPFTVMSCDNIAGNGQVARSMLAAFASLRDPALGDWIASEVAFPSSMVDRITPAT
ncbi:mannitol dehydrogenase family protein, partial [Nocardioides sp. NPDC057772]